MGLGKGGFIGVGTLAMPILALALSPVQGAAILLPILIVQDAVGVWAFRHSWDGHILAVMLPGAVVGVGLGYVFAASLSDRWVLGALGIISIIFALHRLWIERGGRIVAPQKLPDWIGLLCGVGSGLTSQIAHAGAPPFQIFVMPRRLAPQAFIGTTVIYFASVNWMKVPAYAALGQFTTPNLIAAAALMPVAIASTFTGVRLVRTVSAERFYVFVYGLTVLIGVKLLWNAFA